MNLKKNQKGQATVEAILIMTIFLAASMTISQAFSKNNYFASMIEGPWDFVDGMIRDGVWMKSSQSAVNNPNGRKRQGTMESKNVHTANPAFDLKQTQLQ